MMFAWTQHWLHRWEKSDIEDKIHGMNFQWQIKTLDRGLDTDSDTKTELQDRHHESMAKTSTWIKRISTVPCFGSGENYREEKLGSDAYKKYHWHTIEIE